MADKAKTQKTGVKAKYKAANPSQYKEWFNVVGLRYDEPRRVSRIREQTKNKWISIAPMYDAKHDIKDVINFWKKQNQFTRNND